ncbi:hypothetical protein [Mesorhizobium sp. WSM3864]|nr:hypothetical protein [Mesorhizobium sp. WSM3864]
MKFHRGEHTLRHSTSNAARAISLIERKAKLWIKPAKGIVQ